MVKNSNPPTNPKFFSKAITCIWLERSKWNIKPVAKQNKIKATAANFVWYPMMIKIGNIISKIIAGINKTPGIPKLSIHWAVPSYWNILFTPENKKTDDMKILPIRSKKLDIVHSHLFTVRSQSERV